MQSFFDGIPTIFQPMNLIDILIVAFAIYKIIDLLHGKRAERLAKGILILLGISVVANLTGLTTVSWLLLQVQQMLIVAIPIIFAAEFRRVLERLGTGSILRDIFFKGKQNQMDDRVSRRVDQIMGCVTKASASKTGVLIALQKNHSLSDFASTGIPIRGVLSTALLDNIFIPNTPLHDGAVIIDGDEIVAASCYLPLSESRNIPKSLGTRHRAAIGLGEESDAIIVVVSEETGSMSLVIDGKLYYDLSRKDMVTMLLSGLDKQRDIDKFKDGKRVSEDA